MAASDPDVVIVGAGIGGGALAYSLAKAGFEVLQLEKTKLHKDVVRGEWLAPWGVVEADALGLTEIYMATGANRINRHINYDEFLTREQAEAQAIDMGDEKLPPRPLCLGHPTTCNLLNEISVETGVILKRGISALQVSPGQPPKVSYTHDGESYEVTPRLVVGADGRNGIVANHIGAALQTDPEHHLFSGMLVEDAYEWPEDLQVIATEGDVNVLAFPQGEGRVRIYLGWPKEDRGRLVGAQGAQNFLDSWRLKCVPDADVIADAKPASPCIAYPNSDAWRDDIVAEGVVLIGDAAGRNDPIIGQGLSITHRDVRQVRDALLENKNWTPDIFAPYVAERKDRMARLRTIARLTSLRDSAFGSEGRELRARIHGNIVKNPELAAPFSGAFVGPEQLPAEVFSPAFTAEIVGGDIWAEHP